MNKPNRGIPETPSDFDDALAVEAPADVPGNLRIPRGRAKPGPNNRSGRPAIDHRAWAAEALKIDYAAAMRKRRKWFLARIGLFIGLPTLIAALYAFVYASPRYETEFQIIYQSQNTPAAAPSGLLSSFFGVSSTGTDMQRVISSYVKSADLAEAVDRQLDLRGHFSSRKIDALDRLPAHASEEQLVSYFHKQVSVDVMMGGYDVIKVRAFDPAYAAALARAISDNVDKMVDRLSERARTDEMNFAEREVERTQKRMLQAKLETLAFRNEHRNFDPQAMAEQLQTGVLGGLETQLAQYRGALASARQFMGASSPTVKQLQAQIAATEGQMAIEKNQLGSTGAGKQSPASMSDLASRYTGLLLNEQFASDSYVSAKQAYDAARADAMKKGSYAEAFVRPTLPDRATLPNPPKLILATLLISMLAYAALSLIVGSFREQAGV